MDYVHYADYVDYVDYVHYVDYVDYVGYVDYVDELPAARCRNTLREHCRHTARQYWNLSGPLSLAPLCGHTAGTLHKYGHAVGTLWAHCGQTAGTLQAHSKHTAGTPQAHK